MSSLIAEEYDARIGDAHPDAFPLNASSHGYEAARLVKAGSGRLYGLAVYSSNAASQFVQLFDAQAIPADGTAPVLVFTVAAASSAGLYYGSVGRWFERGIVVCNSSTGPAKTLGAADCYFDVQFI